MFKPNPSKQHLPPKTKETSTQPAAPQEKIQVPETLKEKPDAQKPQPKPAQ